MKIYIIRHGETDANRSGRMQGWADYPLNDQGVFLTHETAKGMLEQLGGSIHFDVAYCSTLKRAKETAEIMLRDTGNTDCPVIYDDRIKEINMGDFEGKVFREIIQSDVPEVVKGHLSNPDFDLVFPGGEGIRQVMDRAQEFLRELAAKENEYQDALVSTHGCALRCMLNFLYEDKSNFWQENIPYNCCVNIVDVTDGVITLTDKDRIFYDKKHCENLYD